MSLCSIISYHNIDLCITNQGIYHTIKISGSHLITNLFFEKIKAQKACFMLIETPKNYILGELFENALRFRIPSKFIINTSWLRAMYQAYGDQSKNP